MNFYTSELQEIINQLSQSGFHGYWETLGLILKLLGLLAGPIAGIIFLVLCNVCIPKLVTNRFVTKEQFAKYAYIYIDSCYKKYCPELNTSQLLKKANIVFYTAVWSLTVLTELFLSPFLFVSKDLLYLFGFLGIMFIVMFTPAFRCYNIYNNTHYKEVFNDMIDFYKELDKNEKDDLEKIAAAFEKEFVGRVSKVIVNKQIHEL